MVGVEAEVGAEVSLGLGQVEDLSATYPPGKDPDGCSVGAHAGGSSDLGRGGCPDTHGVGTQEPMDFLRTRCHSIPTKDMYHTHTRDTGKQNERRLENVVA